MDFRAPPLGDSLEDLRTRHPSCSGGSATHPTKKPPPLRIIVPPTEYCPFSTDLTLPITPLSLPTPVSSSCFTFNDIQEPVSQGVSLPLTPAPVPSSCLRVTAVADFASPTSSQFLLMPPTSHLEDVLNGTAGCLLPLATPGAANKVTHSGSRETKYGNLRPWEVSSSTWLSNLGGNTETDDIFRHSLLDITSVDTESSPASTPALSLSALSPSPHVSSLLAPTSLARQLTLLSPALSPSPRTMSPQSSSPARLILKPTGTDTFPSTLDSLQAWRESIMPGLPRSEESRSPLAEDAHASPAGGPIPNMSISPPLPSRQLPSPLVPRVSYVSKSRTLIKHAKTFGGRVKRLVKRQNVDKLVGSMDRGVNFRIVTSQDSENGSVILIAALPPPYDVRPLAGMSHDLVGQEHVRSRTTSEYSAPIRTSMAELATTRRTESSSRQGGSNRSTLRRLSYAALSAIKTL